MTRTCPQRCTTFIDLQFDGLRVQAQVRQQQAQHRAQRRVCLQLCHPRSRRLNCLRAPSAVPQSDADANHIKPPQESLR